jgi:hypothetical protein
MTPQNFLAALRAFSLRQPFQPFSVELVSGDRFHVRHPEGIALWGMLALYIAPDRAVKLFDSSSVCQLYDEST